MKKNIRAQKGITMITLSIAIIILVIVSNILVYNAKDSVYLDHLEKMYSDTETLRDKVIEYSIQYEALPANTEVEYSLDGKDDLKENWISSEELEGKFYVIDLKTLEDVSLNYGRDYEKITQEMSSSAISKLEDIYIVSDVSQNVYYVKGISVEGKKYYSDREKDETVIELKHENTQNEKS